MIAGVGRHVGVNEGVTVFVGQAGQVAVEFLGDALQKHMARSLKFFQKAVGIFHSVVVEGLVVAALPFHVLASSAAELGHVDMRQIELERVFDNQIVSFICVFPFLVLPEPR